MLVYKDGQMKTFKQQISTVILLVPSEDEEGRREYQEYKGQFITPVIYRNDVGQSFPSSSII